MCNSYSNGLCLYYGVSIKEMNNKCDRGDCMDVESFAKTIKHIKVKIVKVEKLTITV